MFLAVIAVCVVVLVAVASMVVGAGSAAKTKQTCVDTQQACAQLILYAEQDTNPMIRLIHATSAVAYADVLNSLSTPENQKQVLGLSSLELKEQAKRAQQNAIDAFQLIPKSPLAVSAGWQK